MELHHLQFWPFGANATRRDEDLGATWRAAVGGRRGDVMDGRVDGWVGGLVAEVAARWMQC